VTAGGQPGEKPLLSPKSPATGARLRRQGSLDKIYWSLEMEIHAKTTVNATGVFSDRWAVWEGAVLAGPFDPSWCMHSIVTTKRKRETPQQLFRSPAHKTTHHAYSSIQPGC